LKIASKGITLPNLDQNIKCGNSLVEDNTIDRKAFVWNEEFKHVRSDVKFDVIIGNPPYGATFSKNDRSYFRKNYLSVSRVIDSYILFTERSTKLLEKNGVLGFIVPETWLTNPSNKNLRGYLLDNFSILQLVDIPGMVFPGATVDTVILILGNTEPVDHKAKILFAEPTSGLAFSKENYVLQSSYLQLRDFSMNTNFDEQTIELVKNIETNSIKLKEICKNTRGLETGDNKKYLSKAKEDSDYLPIITGDDIHRYRPIKTKYFVKYGEWLSSPKSLKLFEGDKIVLQRIKNQNLKRRLVATVDRNNLLILDSVHMMYNIDEKYHPYYILAMINSWLLNFYFKLFSLYPRINADDLDNLPIKSLPMERQKIFIDAVDKILQSKKAYYPQLPSLPKDKKSAAAHNSCTAHRKSR